MKRLIPLMIALFFFGSCAGLKTETGGSPQSPATASGPVQPPDKPVLHVKRSIAPLFGKLLRDVAVSGTAFNPGQGERVTLSYALSRPAVVTVRVYDPDTGLIRVESGGRPVDAGRRTFAWDGRDMDGAVVPDEAYFFTITARDGTGAVEIYDPTTFSGGVSHDITEAHIDHRDHTINYRLPESGRVMIRMGIQGGPLMHQLVDWKPRIRGAITEHWNGKDRDNQMDLYGHPGFKMIVTYFSLPDNSVITYGNKALPFLEYKARVTEKRPVKPERESSVAHRSRHYSIPRSLDYTPELKVSFVNAKGRDENGLPVLSGKTLVKVALDEKDMAVFQRHQFEICFFLDHRFHAEDETGYTPFNWVWDLSGVAEGEHLLTVNISSFQDQIGLVSRKVKVVK